MMKIQHLLFTLVCGITLGGCGRSGGPPSGVAEKVDVYTVLHSEFASTGDPVVSRDSEKSFLVEASKGLWKTDVNFTLSDGRNTLEKYIFSSDDEVKAIKSLKTHAEKVLIANGCEIRKVSEEQAKANIAYRKGAIAGSISFVASSSGNKMNLSYSHEER